MANKYSKLSIDKEKLPNWIKLWCEENITGKFNIKMWMEPVGFNILLTMKERL